MGQKAHPYGLRLGYIKPWKAKWFSNKDTANLLAEDLKLRDYLKKKLGFAGISSTEIERSSGRVRVRIYTARPGVIIGRRGQEIDKVKDDLSKLTQSELFVDIKEIKSPQTDAQLVAENIAQQLEKRASHRRSMKKAIQLAMSRGALGIKILCKGRLGGSEIARKEKYHEGKVPLNTFRADVDYGCATAFTTYGTTGIKVWIYKGDILVKKEEAEQRRERIRQQQEMAKEKTSKGASKAKEQKATAETAKEIKEKSVTAPVSTPTDEAQSPAAEQAAPESEAGSTPEKTEEK